MVQWSREGGRGSYVYLFDSHCFFAGEASVCFVVIVRNPYPEP